MTNKLWDDVRKSLQDLGNIAAEKGKVFSKAAADKAEELTRTGKLKLDVLQVNREIERYLAELGGKVYGLNKDDQLDTLADDAGIQAIFDKIAVLEEKKQALEDKMARQQAAEAAQSSESTDAGEAADEEPAEADDGAGEDAETSEAK